MWDDYHRTFVCGRISMWEDWYGGILVYGRISMEDYYVVGLVKEYH